MINNKVDNLPDEVAGKIQIIPFRNNECLFGKTNIFLEY